MLRSTLLPLRALARGMCSLPPLITKSSGLMYRDILPIPSGEKAIPARPMWAVAINYTGRLEDGTVFDSSVGKSPLKFTLGARDVVKGMDEGLEGMVVGGRRQLVIPPHLGYGPRGAPPAIPSNVLLHFDIELVSVGEDPGLWARIASLLKALPFK
jgi:FKBP-type peptidyl-prolyl cis-trans isomerase FkpA